MDKDKTHINLSDLIKKKKVVPIGMANDFEDIKPIDYNDMMTIAPLPIEYAMYPFLPAKGRSYIFAATGVGKTLFTMNVAYAIAMGGNYLKYTCPKPRKILYVDGEMSFEEIHGRFLNIVSQQGKLEYFPQNFSILTPDKVYPKRLPKICNPDGQAFYTSLVKSNQIEVIIFDNLSTLSEIDENKPNEWLVIQDWLISLSAANVASIIVHHAGKNQKEFRGTSRMLDTMQSAILLEHVENDSSPGKKIRLSYRKARGFGETDSYPFEISIENNRWSYQSGEQSDLIRCVEKVQAGMTQRDIANELGYSQSKIFRITQRAKKLGLLRDQPFQPEN